MANTGFHPLGFDEASAFEAAQQGIDSALGDNQTGAVFQAAQEFQAIKAAGPETGEGGQFHASFTKLYFPLTG
jgi:hypothetical protein